MLKTFQVYWNKEDGVLRLHQIDGETGEVIKDITGFEAFKFFSQWKKESTPPISQVNSSGLRPGDDDLLQVG